MHASSVAGPASGGVTRTRTRPLQSTEQSRQQRVQYELHRRMQGLRARSRRDRRKRGVLVDAWLKCNLLPDDFDSDDDDAGRWGGVDVVYRTPTPGGKSDHAGPEDAGEAARNISEGLRHIGRALDGVHLPKQRTRLRLDTVMDAPVVARADVPPSAVRLEPASAIVRSAMLTSNADDLPPKLKKQTKPRAKPRMSAVADLKSADTASLSSTTGGRRRRKPAVKKTGDGGDGDGRHGEKGIPVKEFLRDVGDEPRSEASGLPDEDAMSGMEVEERGRSSGWATQNAIASRERD